MPERFGIQVVIQAEEVKDIAATLQTKQYRQEPPSERGAYKTTRQTQATILQSRATMPFTTIDSKPAFQARSATRTDKALPAANTDEMSATCNARHHEMTPGRCTNRDRLSHSYATSLRRNGLQPTAELKDSQFRRSNCALIRVNVGMHDPDLLGCSPVESSVEKVQDCLDISF